jgi:hypothetical protein
VAVATDVSGLATGLTSSMAVLVLPEFVPLPGRGQGNRSPWAAEDL